jgi:ATP/maltotriose-dependent transcriptional regulator MalT
LSVLEREHIGPADDTPLGVLVELLEAAVLCGEADVARLLVGRLAPVAHLLVPALTSFPPVVTSVARHLGAGLALLGQREQARVATEQARVLAEHVRFRPELALASLQLAELMLDKGEAEPGLVHLRNAIDDVRAMRMQPAFSRALKRLWQYEAAQARSYCVQGRLEEADRAAASAWSVVHELADVVPDETARAALMNDAEELIPTAHPFTPRQAAKLAAGGLTEREREVAALIAVGKSNREIAEALVLGERTIETHVSSILSKLGFSARAQVAAWATERNMRPGARSW